MRLRDPLVIAMAEAEKSHSTIHIMIISTTEVGASALILGQGVAHKHHCSNNDAIRKVTQVSRPDGAATDLTEPRAMQAFRLQLRQLRRCRY